MRNLVLLFTACVCAHAMSREDLLRKSGKSVENFWNQIQAVNCVETVEQAKLGRDGKLQYRQESVFDYLAILQLVSNDMIVEESRSPMEQPAAAKRAPAKPQALLITNGFASFEFIFHPFYQSHFEYSEPESVKLDGHDAFAVRFRQVHGARTPSVLKLKQREFPLEWAGTAWIDPASGAIIRISAALMTSMADVGLHSLNADVRYARVNFKEDGSVHWLPSVATIEAETARQRWRNVHTFSKYRHFSVDVKTMVEEPK